MNRFICVYKENDEINGYLLFEDIKQVYVGTDDKYFYIKILDKAGGRYNISKKFKSHAEAMELMLKMISAWENDEDYEIEEEVSASDCQSISNFARLDKFIQELSNAEKYYITKFVCILGRMPNDSEILAFRKQWVNGLEVKNG